MVDFVFKIIEEALKLFKLSYLKFATQLKSTSGIAIELEYNFTIVGFEMAGKVTCTLTWQGIYCIIDLLTKKSYNFLSFGCSYRSCSWKTSGMRDRRKKQGQTK